MLHGKLGVAEDYHNYLSGSEAQGGCADMGIFQENEGGRKRRWGEEYTEW